MQQRLRSPIAGVVADIAVVVGLAGLICACDGTDGIQEDGGEHRPDELLEQVVQASIPGTATPAANGSWDSSPSSSQDLSTDSGFWSDQQISVSGSHVVITQRASIGFFTRQGQQLQHTTGDAFFAGVAPSGSRVFDLRTVFDEFRNRFVIVGMANSPTAGDSRTLIAVSQTQDPRKGWCVYWVGGPDPRQNYDYPLVAVSPTAYILTYNGNGLNILQMLPAAAVSSCSSNLTGMWTFWNPTLKTGDNNPPGLIAPAMMHMSPPAHDFFYAVTRYGNNNVTVWKVTDPVSSSRTLQAFNIAIPGEAFTNAFPDQFGNNAPQRGSTFTIGMYLFDNRTSTPPLKAVYNGAQGELAFVTNDAHDWGSGLAASIRVVALVPESATIKKNRKWGAAGSHYGWPGLESNSSGDYAISFLRTGASIFPEVRYSAWGVGDSDIRGSVLLKTNGTSYANPGACGQYCAQIGRASCRERV